MLTDKKPLPWIRYCDVLDVARDSDGIVLIADPYQLFKPTFFCETVVIQHRDPLAIGFSDRDIS